MAPTPDLSFAEVGEILALLQRVEGADVVLEWGDLRIEVRRGAAPEVTAEPARQPAQQQPEQVAEHPTPAAPAEQPAEQPSGDVPEQWVALTAPMVGTFYRAAKPGDPPFVEVGQSVEKGATLGLIEVMKLFTELEAEVTGTVVRVDAEDASLVEFGQPLLWVDPA